MGIPFGSTSMCNWGGGLNGVGGRSRAVRSLVRNEGVRKGRERERKRKHRFQRYKMCSKGDKKKKIVGQ